MGKVYTEKESNVRYGIATAMGIILFGVALGVLLGGKTMSTLYCSDMNVPIKSVHLIISNADPNQDDEPAYIVEFSDDTTCKGVSIGKIKYRYSYEGARNLLYPIKFPERNYVISRMEISSNDGGKNFYFTKPPFIALAL